MFSTINGFSSNRCVSSFGKHFMPHVISAIVCMLL
jgi:hypothetical protein